MTRSEAVTRGRELFEDAWEEARARLSAADREEPLEPRDGGSVPRPRPDPGGKGG